MKHQQFIAAAVIALLCAPLSFAEDDGKITEGRLDAVGPAGQLLGTCALRHTAVDAEISGTLARVRVTQKFHNPFRDKIEAVYVFPLHQDSAVDEMTLTVGDRVVKGVIKERGEARRIYDKARAAGKAASLLDQERPNIFFQAVANIEPGQEVAITICYSQTLAWEDGRYGFDFPTVVGPRYIPGTSQGSPDGKPTPSFIRKRNPQRGPDGEPPVVNPSPVSPTGQVPDADRITPPVVEEGYRSGHDISITVRIQAGLPISDLRSALHEIQVEHPEGDPTCATVSLVEKNSLPNRDFVISYRTAGDGVTDAVLTHADERGNFFTLVLQPPVRVNQEQVVPRELVFVLDTSGSMAGFPIETSKAIMRRAINHLRPEDRFNLVTFAGATAVLFKRPVENTGENRRRALGFIDTLQGAGGTEMMKAIETALGGDHDPEKLRIVCFLTDGYVGNDQAMIGAVRKHAETTRVFSFGIGSSVNRFLLDGMAQAGRGEACYVLRHEDAGKTADTFYERIDAPVLTGITLDFGNLAVEEVYPQRVEDLFAAKPVVVKGRYTRAGDGVIKLKGRNAAGSYEREIVATFPGRNPDNVILASQWARAKVGHLMMQDMEGIQREHMKPELKQEITKLGIDYHLMTQFTSFVAVEERRITEGGAPRTVQVPVEMPEDVSYSGNFGEMSALSSLGKGGPSGGLGGSGGGFGMGSGTGKLFGLVPQAMGKRCSKADRLQQLKENGGTPACEEAVVKTLDWLKQRQNPDGSWCASHRVAMTSHALLAYLGHCETPISEKYGESVMKAVVFLVNESAKNQGRLADDLNDKQWPHTHAIATSALAESLVFAKEIKLQVPGLEDAVRNAAQWIIDHQLKMGAWDCGGPKRDGVTVDGDVLLTCENLQALKAAAQTGVKLQGLSACVGKGLGLIKASQNADGSIGHADKEDAALTGAGALVYHLWGKGSDEVTRKASDQLAGQAEFQWNAAGVDLCAHHYKVRAMFQSGGKRWTDFNAISLPGLLGAQNLDGSFKDLGPAPVEGRQVPELPFQGNAELGVHYRTCLAVLTLEVYYRFGTGHPRTRHDP